MAIAASRRRIPVPALAALAAAALFGGLVHAVLVTSSLAEPAEATVYGPTARRVWASAAAGLASLGVVVGALALVRPQGRIGALLRGRIGAIAPLLAGPVAVVQSGSSLATASGGPGSGNGAVMRVQSPESDRDPGPQKRIHARRRRSPRPPHPGSQLQ